MKRMLLFLVFFLVAVSVMTAQEELMNFYVIEEAASFDLFSNELGAALDPNLLRSNPGFASLDKNYMLFGLSSNHIVSGFSFTDFVVGGYNKDLKATGALSFYAFSNDSGYTNNVTSNTVNKTVGTTTYTYTTDVTEQNYAVLEEQHIRFSSGIMKNFGTSVMGLALDFSFDNGVSSGASTFADDNRTDTTTYYYDAAGAASAPDVQEDYKATVTRTSPDSDIKISVMFPFFKPLDGAIKGIGVSARLDWTNQNRSKSVTYDYTASKNTFGTPSTTDTELIEFYNIFRLSSDATLSLSPIFTGDDRNLLNLIFSGYFDVNIPNEVTDKTITKAWNISPGSVSSVISSETDVTTEKGLGLGWSLSAEAEHPVYFVFGDWAELGIAPGAGLSASYRGSTYDKTKTTVTKTDGNADGDFNDAVDTITTTTTTYYNNNDGVDLDINIPISVKSAFKWKNPDWIFGLTVGVDAGFTPTITLNYDKADAQYVKSETKDGTGALTSTSETLQMPGDYAAFYTKLDWSFYQNSRMCLNFYLPNDIRFDVSLNGSNLFDFESLNVQMIIPLP